MQMNIAVALNLWGDIVTMSFWLFLQKLSLQNTLFLQATQVSKICV